MARNRRADRIAREAKYSTLAERYEREGPMLGEELRVIAGRWDGASGRVLGIHGRTVVLDVREARPLRLAYGRDELAPIAVRIFPGR